MLNPYTVLLKLILHSMLTNWNLNENLEKIKRRPWMLQFVGYILLFMPNVCAHNVTNTQDYELGRWLLCFQSIPLGPLIPSIPERPGDPGEPGSP